MKTEKQMTSVIVNLMDCVTGTTTPSEGVGLFKAMDKALKASKGIKLSLKDSTPLSFLNASFGELYKKYGYAIIRENVSLINYLPSQAKAIKYYLQSLDKLTR